jgi:CheY-like chemotaxis protein
MEEVPEVSCSNARQRPRLKGLGYCASGVYPRHEMHSLRSHLRKVDRRASEGMSIYLATDFSINGVPGGFKTCASKREHIDGPTKPEPNGPRDLSRAAAVRVLVVEDFEPFRKFVTSALAGVRDLQVIGEVSDGLAAVQKAVELQPDLILLDIGLPTLNRIEAARQIRKLVPESKIIFLSQESSADVVQEARSIGAWGYVAKTRAGTELLAAVEAIMSGKRFVSE